MNLRISLKHFCASCNIYHHFILSKRCTASRTDKKAMALRCTCTILDILCEGDFEEDTDWDTDWESVEEEDVTEDSSDACTIPKENKTHSSAKIEASGDPDCPFKEVECQTDFVDVDDDLLFEDGNDN